MNNINHEHSLGKGEVVSSILPGSTSKARISRAFDTAKNIHPVSIVRTNAEFVASSRGKSVESDRASFTLAIAPCTVKAARKVVKAWHRHFPIVQGGLFAAQCVDESGACMGAAIAGNPSRAWQGTGRIVISRVATAGAENACSMLYGALCRAAKALGYREAWTYTLPDEPGTSLRAAGFMDMGLTDGGEWDRPSRARKPAASSEPKRRWLRKLAQ